MPTIISQTNPRDIFDKFTKGFVLPGADKTDVISQIASNLRRKEDGIFFKSKYDEPTYLTFRIAFDFDCSEDYAIASVANGNEKFNEIPHPFLNIILNDAHSNGTTTPSSKLKRDLEFLTNSGLMDGTRTTNGTYASIVNKNNIGANESLDIYSTYNYLKYNLGEDFRALYLLMFKTMLYDISINYPFAFTSIEGLGNLFKTDTKTGVRLNQENAIITINCNESLDLRITQLQDWYRQIVWDSVYQRWLVPDMMRYFKMRIYISELRLFHKAEKSARVGDNAGVQVKMTSHDINEIIPTICLDCTQCEFVMDENMQHMNAFHSSNVEKAQTTPKIRIRVGNVTQRSSYGLNKNNKYSIVDDNILKRYRSYEDADDYGSYDNNGDDTGTVSSNLYSYSTPDAISKTLERLGVDFSDEDNGTYDTARTLDKNLMTKIRDIINASDNGNDVEELLNEVLTEPLGKQTVREAISTAVEPEGKVLVNSLEQSDKISTATKYDQSILGNMFSNLVGLISTALNGYPELTELSSANGNITRELAQRIVERIPSSKATEMNDSIGRLYSIVTTGTVSEATQDTDNGYTEVSMERTEYSSTANEQILIQSIPEENKGTSNEAIEDTDEGYVESNVIRTPYVSTANNSEMPQTIPETNKGTSNEAIEDTDEGYIDNHITRPTYTSTANSSNITQNIPESNKGLSNEAIEDADNGFVPNSISRGAFMSTANKNGEDTQRGTLNREIHSEANEDLDEGYVRVKLVRPEQSSTATSGTLKLVSKLKR